MQTVKRPLSFYRIASPGQVLAEGKKGRAGIRVPSTLDHSRDDFCSLPLLGRDALNGRWETCHGAYER
jgi:hypothetical protein